MTEKAFDSIEFTPLFTALANQEVDPAYITIPRDLYNGATSTLKLHKDSNKISLERAARQGDNISLKLFTACLQDAIINKIDWEEKKINMDGAHLSYLIFADDIILIAHTPQEQEMLIDINNYSKPVGLNMHLGKTKIMLNNHTEKATVEVDGKATEEVEKYIYLGKTVSRDGDLMPEIKRRITLGWAAFNKVDNIMRSRKASMERIMLSITLRDQRHNTWIWQLTGVTDIIDHIRQSKHRWAGHVARLQDNRWTIRATSWVPRRWLRP